MNVSSILQILRGSVRPVTTYLLVGALVVLVFTKDNPDLLTTFKDLVLVLGGFWFGARNKTQV